MASASMLGGGGPALQLQGERTSGEDIRTQNVTAVAAIANIVKSSLGPVGLDKASCAKPGLENMRSAAWLIWGSGRKLMPGCAADAG